MKRLSVMVSSAVLLVATAVAALLTGCEADSATESLTISPSSATLSLGQSQQFTVSGGYEYTWSLATPAWGTLSSSRGATVVYTSRYAPTANESQTITVNSTITGTSSEGASNAAYSVSGTAQVTHQGTTGVSTTLSISSSASSLTTNATATLTASGGTSPYNWTKSNGSLGTLSASSGASVTYTASGGPGVNTITCTDGAATSKSVTITQL